MDANEGLISSNFQPAEAREFCDISRRGELRSESPELVARASAISAIEPARSNGAEKAQPKGQLARLALIPFVEPKREPSPSETKAIWPRWFDFYSAAVSLIMIALISVGAIYDHQSTLMAASARESESLASTVSALKLRLDAIESSRGREDGAELRKALGEIKAQISTTREIGAALVQLTARVDHVERDHGTRLDKLSEHIDHDSPSRVTDIVARLDILERKSAPPVISPVAPSSGKQAILPTRVDLSNPSDTIGSIEKPRPFLRGFIIDDVRDGYAAIESRLGTQSVAPGDFIPGAGRLIRIERHGRAWAVITSLGVIESDPPPY